MATVKYMRLAHASIGCGVVRIISPCAPFQTKFTPAFAAFSNTLSSALRTTNPTLTARTAFTAAGRDPQLSCKVR